MNYIKLEELSIDELELGIKRALENAEDMINEGDILYENESYPRSYTLYQLAIEEIGKSRILFSLIINLRLENEIDFKEINKDFMHHQTKSKSAITFEMAALLVMHSTGDESADERKKKFFTSLEDLQAESENINRLNNYKNDSLYIGIAEKKFISPKDVITKEMTDELRTNSLIRLEASRTILKGMLNDVDKLVKGIKEVDDDDEFKIDDQFFDQFFRD
ncbi:MAG: AbiV family abortive infection protein [Segetibacter sp.]